MICDEFIGGFKVHPLARMFQIRRPKSLNGVAFEDSVQKVGVQVPVTLDQEGYLVDGRCRAKAYEDARASAPARSRESPTLPTEVRRFADLGEVFQFLKDKNGLPDYYNKGQLLAIFVLALERMPEPSESFQKKPLTACWIAHLANATHYQASKVLKLFREQPKTLSLVAQGMLPLGEAYKAMCKGTEFIKADLSSKFGGDEVSVEKISQQTETDACPPEVLREFNHHNEPQLLIPFPQ